MVSPEVVRRRLRLLEKYVQRLGQLRAQTKIDAFISDEDVQAIAERYLQLAIESLLDIGQHIIASAGWEPAEDYAGVFETLREHGVLSDELYLRVRGMAGFRNLLVHGYADLDQRQVFQILRDHLDDLQDVAQVFQKYVESA